jgi:hypothetical protein
MEDAQQKLARLRSASAGLVKLMDREDEELDVVTPSGHIVTATRRRPVEPAFEMRLDEDGSTVWVNANEWLFACASPRVPGGTFAEDLC